MHEWFWLWNLQLGFLGGKYVRREVLILSLALSGLVLLLIILPGGSLAVSGSDCSWPVPVQLMVEGLAPTCLPVQSTEEMFSVLFPVDIRHHSGTALSSTVLFWANCTAEYCSDGICTAQGTARWENLKKKIKCHLWKLWLYLGFGHLLCLVAYKFFSILA